MMLICYSTLMSDLSKRWFYYLMNFWSGLANQRKFESIEYLDKNYLNVSFRSNFVFLQNLFLVECELKRLTIEPKNSCIDRFHCEANINWPSVSRPHIRSFRDLNLTDIWVRLDVVFHNLLYSANRKLVYGCKDRQQIWLRLSCLEPCPICRRKTINNFCFIAVRFVNTVFWKTCINHYLHNRLRVFWPDT